MTRPTLFRNAVGRSFAVGQYAIAHDEPIPGRAYPCRVIGEPATTPDRAAPPLVPVDLFLPNAANAVNVHVDAANLFPTFDAIAYRSKLPTWFAVNFDVSVPQFCSWNDTAAAREVAEAFAVRRYFHDERYETLDRWLGAVDRFVDVNTLKADDRAAVDRLRSDIQRERVAALRRRETANQQGAASC